MRSPMFAFVATITLGWMPASAWAFGSVHVPGQHAEHEKITRLGLAPFKLGEKTMKEIAGSTGIFGAVAGPDRPDRGMMDQKAAHCDGADTLPVRGYPQSAAKAQAQLEACRTRIVKHIEDAVREAGKLVDAQGRVVDAEIPTRIPCVFDGRRGRGKCNVLERLGLALHAAQDFYSHTNWVDFATSEPIGPKNPPGLGNTGRAPWLDPRLKVPFPAGLISGCYDGIPESRNCRYGDGQLRAKHEDLNKDAGDIDVETGAIGPGKTDRGKIHGNFERAVRAAIDDTRDKWAYFEERLLTVYGAGRGAVIICAMRRDDPAGCKPQP